MTEKDSETKLSATPADADTPLVSRSAVSPKSTYGEYRQDLRHDFWYTCAYCTMSEYEAQGISFEIDHYVPVSEDAALENTYGNLMYVCRICNGRKSAIYPNEKQQAAGYRYFKADEDVWVHHFFGENFRIKTKTLVVEYTEDMLDLNRDLLRRLRQIRHSIDQADSFVAQGVDALRKFHLDRLPPELRSRANAARKGLSSVAAQAAGDIEEILRSAVKSPLLDPDSGKPAFLAKRAERLRELGALYPGATRRTRKPRKK